MATRHRPIPEQTFLTMTQEQIEALISAPPDKPIVMLNLVRFREVADYSDHPELAPETPISGAEAYEIYREAVDPILSEVGGERFYLGSGHATVIGPPDEHWDQVFLARYEDLASFGALGQHPEHQKIVGHRLAAMLDARLIVTTPATE